MSAGGRVVCSRSSHARYSKSYHLKHEVRFPWQRCSMGKSEKFSLQAKNGMALKRQFPNVLSILFKEEKQNRF